MIKAILIDIDNTLLDFHLSVVYSLERVFKEFNIPFKDEYVPKFIEINDGLWRKIENNELTREQLFEIRFNTVFKALNIDADGVSVETAFRRELFDSAVLVDGAKEILQYLSSKYKVYAASNAIYDQQVNRLKKAGILEYITDVFVSDRTGYKKPNKEFFDYCFSNMDGATKSQTVMIGDSLSADILGAYNFNMKSIWYNIDKKPIPEDLTANYVVDDLLEIKNIL